MSQDARRRAARAQPVRLNSPPVLNQAFEAAGFQIARYSRWAIRSAHVALEGEPPPAAHIAVTWHSMNMVGLAVHAEWRPQAHRAFVPPGIAGAAMRGWLLGTGVEPVPLPPDGCGNPVAGLREMTRALGEGLTIGIALDGPHGPARILRPGALWLARLSGKPLVPMGYAVRPAVRLPRWDRLLVPLPNARIAVVCGAPIHIERHAAIDDELRARVVGALDHAERRAWAILDSGVSLPGPQRNAR
jgi:lysophospholipid acyltransferase (LPLAT)-like uncharacterized protein